MESPNFKDFSNIEKTYKINRYDFHRGGVEVAQVEQLIKRLKSHADDCNGECGECSMNEDLPEDAKTFCEAFSDLEIGKPKSQQNKAMHKNAGKCIAEDLNGETKFRGFQVYTKVLDKLNIYISKNQDKKVKDIVSLALAEYMARHK
jgi:hypothetical protein